MTARELMHRLIDHTADGRALDDEVLVKIDGEIRTLSVAYSNGTLILQAGRIVRR